MAHEATQSASRVDVVRALRQAAITNELLEITTAKMALG